MRLVIRPAGTCPTHLQLATVQVALDLIVQTSNKKLVDGQIYRAPYFNSHGEPCSATLDALRPYYHSKCAYCESINNLEVEHYRPVGAQRGQHIGYIWLCYEWTNLLPACHDCNTFAGGKGAKFAVLGTRQQTAPLMANGNVDTSRNALIGSYLTVERPQLLHPEVDNPILFLTVKPALQRDGFELHGLDATNRGAYSIRTCNLNRKPLRLERLALLQDMKADIEVIFQTLSAGIIDKRMLLKAFKVTFRKWEVAAADDKRSHTFVRRCTTSTVSIFNLLLVPLLKANQQTIVTQAFVLHKAGRL